MATLTLHLTDDTTHTFTGSDEWVTTAAQKARDVQGHHNRMFWFTDVAVKPTGFSVSGVLIQSVTADLDS
ncbi:hypothetical protein K7W42_18010 [Deinococcus sp. HMF7604]|uniref:hypothetical protein n=1 Tax=Deinococcus betulae TaxID=2873312 RepID=UPI001CCBDDFC|nr:hypothetical protein [Deinococcus betulae]MBZ9752740.1 hypothetical protein [Deinococcus betulae]